MLEKTAQVSSPLKPPGGFVYQRHKPEDTDFYKIIEQNLPSFQSHLSSADISLPGFVHEEFRKYLRCGLLKHGFLRVKCGGCRFEHLAWAAPYLFMQTSRVLSILWSTPHDRNIGTLGGPCNACNACTTMGSQLSMAIAFTFRTPAEYT
jgi:hypothetical protein